MAKRYGPLAALVLAAGLIVLTIVLPVTAQSPEPSDPLELYDDNDDGVIDEDELIRAASDHISGLIDRDLLLRVMELHLAGGSQTTTQPSADPAGPLELYDDNDNGVIDVDELIRVVTDHLAGLIDRGLLLRVMELHSSGGSQTTTQPSAEASWSEACELYDTNNDGAIDKSEADQANKDYEAGLISRDEMLDVISCYVFGPPTPTPTPSPTPTPVWPEACERYDTNNDGAIDTSEVNQANKDYEAGLISRDEMLDVIACYVFGPPAPTPTPTPSKTPTLTKTPTPTNSPIPTPTQTPRPPTPAPTRTSTPTKTPTPRPTPTPTNTPTPTYAVNITKTLPGVTSMYLEWETTGWAGKSPPPTKIRWCKKLSFWPDPCSDVAVGTITSLLLTGLDDDRGYNFRVSVNVGSGTSEIWKESPEEVDNTHSEPDLKITDIDYPSLKSTSNFTVAGGYPRNVLASAEIRVEVKGTVTSQQFALEAQPGSGLQTSNAFDSQCAWGTSPTPTPLSKWKGGPNPSFYVERCGVGDGSSKLVVKVRDATPMPASGNISETEYFSQKIRRAWHHNDNTVAYKIEPTPIPTPPMPSVPDAVATAAAIWNDRSLGVDFCEYPCASKPDLDHYSTSIKVVGIITESGCTDAVACHDPGSDYSFPRIGSSEIQIENPPVEGQSNSKTWYNNLYIARLSPFDRYYLPVYIAHEMGHSMGLHHHPPGHHLMLRPNDVIGLWPSLSPLPGLMSDDDKEAAKSIYKNHTPHPDPH